MTSGELSWPAANQPVAEYLSALTDRTRAILGSNLVGVYAAGSLALGSYQQGRSDIDIAIVCGAALDRPTKEQLIAALRHEALPCPARGLELVVYTAAVAGAGTPEPGFEVELNTGPLMDFRATWAGEDRTEPDGTFWYAIDRSILAERGRSLVGPPATEIFRSVPLAALIELLIASLRWHLALQHDLPTDQPAAWTSDAVLNASRALRRVQSGTWADKVTAGREIGQATADQLGVDGSSVVQRDVVAQALAARSGAAGPSVGQARQFQRAVLAALQRAAR
jgi:hypothetical protein